MDQSEAGVRALRRLRGARRPPRPRRLRDGLLVAVIPQAPAARHDQDRPLVRRRSRRASRPVDRRGGHRPRPRPGIGVVAEGIETERQLERLRELGCDLGQGYLFSRPIAAAKAAPLASAGRRSPRRPPSAAPAESLGEGQARCLREGPLVAAAEQAQHEQEQVDEVQVQVERADDGRLLHRPVAIASSPFWMRWTSYAVRAVKRTTPTIEMIQARPSLPRKMFRMLATRRPMRPMNRMPRRPASERFVVRRRRPPHRTSPTRTGTPSRRTRPCRPR